MNFTRHLLIIRFTKHNSNYQTQLSWGKLRREPATKWLDEYFAPLHKCEHRFARQNACRTSIQLSLDFILFM